MIERICNELALLPMVKAIALSGSRTSAINDESSDWDIYIYSDQCVPEKDRERILSSLSSCSINCSPFEEGDEAVSERGDVYDLMYRSLDWTEWQIDDVWRKLNARIGYTTCFLYNIKSSEILYDDNAWFSTLQSELGMPYPERLRENIIRKNMDVIDGKGKSTFLIQAELAWKRDDIVSQNHRLSAILSSIFDALFAYNRALHPGEKKLLRYTHILCTDIPENFDENVQRAIRAVGTDDYIPSLRALIDSTKEFLEYNP